MQRKKKKFDWEVRESVGEKGARRKERAKPYGLT